MRRVLLVCHSYPPGVQYVLRAVKFAELLPKHGWDVVVLTPGGVASDANADMISPRQSVIRTRHIPTLSTLARRWRSRGSPERYADRPHIDRPSRNSHGMLERFARRALLWGDTPDAMVGWVPFATTAGLRAVRQLNIDVVCATAPAFSTAVTGALISRWSHVPLVLDFRDVWTLDERDPFGVIGGSFVAEKARRRLALIRRLEKHVVTRAEHVVFASTEAQRRYVCQYPSLGGRTSTIFNGAEPDEFRDVEPFASPTIAHVGTIHGYQLLQVVSLLRGFARARESDLPKNTRLTFVGFIAEGVEDIRSEVNRLRLTEFVEFTGPIPHADALDHMQRSHVLLLFSGKSRVPRLSKISEYVATGRPVLAFGEADSETGREVVKYGGVITASSDPEDIARLLRVAFERFSLVERAGISIADPHPLNRETNARDLANVLEQVASRAD